MFNIEASKELSLQLLSQVSERVGELAPNAKIIFGLTQNSKLRNEIRLTILATSGEVEKKPKKKKEKITKKKKTTVKKVKTEKKEKEVEVRRSALEIKEAEKKEEEKEEEEEKIFDIPAFLRKSKDKK
jgi:cell division GTPase FtsZ